VRLIDLADGASLIRPTVLIEKIR
jgi:uncharacterized ferritin-like protein (DUF455 family)